jgi:D-psicose/D-tagatose/L-ribulose 3-epimerase
LTAVCRIGAGLGATRLVFGSPKNRDRTGLSDADALERAVEFFRRLGDAAQEQGVIVCLEPNPPQYGANFMTTSSETAKVVEAIGHSAIRMQFDSGALTISEESPQDVLARSASLIGHVHASEPDLMPLGDGRTDHHKMHAALSQYLANHVVSVEMVATKGESHLLSIVRALVCAVDAYRPVQGSTR